MLIAFAGLKGSGKDTAAQVLIDEFDFTRIAFADGVRKAALVIDPIIPIISTYGQLDESFNARMLSERLSHLVTTFGWDQIKRDIPEVRRLLQVIGTEFGRSIDPDIWIQALYNRFPDIGNPETNYVITDCRFENEVKFVHLKGGDVCWIERPGLVSDGHESEDPTLKDKVDYIAHNDDTLAEFQEDIRFMMVLKGVNEIKSRTARNA